MKRISALFTFLCLNIIAFTQQNFFDVVILKSGETHTGIIFEQIPFRILKICTEEGDSLELKPDEIEVIFREPVSASNMSSENFSEQKGYRWIVESGISRSLPPNDFTAYYKLNFEYGYRFNPYFFLGGGIGLRYPYIENNSYHYKGQASPVFNDFGVPLFIDTRINFSARRISPFFALSNGYSFDMRNNDDMTREKKYSLSQIKGVGFVLTATAGVSFRFSDSYALYTGISYELQKFKKFMDGYNYYEGKLVSSSNCISINIGVSF
jgi:hypothetical protein